MSLKLFYSFFLKFGAFSTPKKAYLGKIREALWIIKTESFKIFFELREKLESTDLTVKKKKSETTKD